MSHLSTATDKKLKQFDFFFKIVKETMGFVPNSMKTMAKVPAILGGFSAFTGLILANPHKPASPLAILKLTFKNIGWGSKFAKNKNRIPIELKSLVSFVTSRAAGCMYCQAHTISTAKENGVSGDKLSAVWEFESSDLYTEAERSALRFGLAAGSTPNAVTKEHFDDLKKHFTEENIIELGTVVSIFGFLNRWNETFSTQLEAEPIHNGKQYLADHGWNVGRHE